MNDQRAERESHGIPADAEGSQVVAVAAVSAGSVLITHEMIGQHTTGGVNGLDPRDLAATFKVFRGIRLTITSMTASLKSTRTQAAEPPSQGSLVGSQVGLLPLEPVPSRVPLHLVEPEGQLQVHTAPYRGSFSMVFSQAMRAAGLGSRVLIAQFLKGGVQQGPAGCVNLCGGLAWLRPDVQACLSEAAVEQARPAVEAVWQNCRQHLMQGDLDQLVLDELGLAVALGYLDEQELIDALEQRPGSMDVIITGPAIPASVMSMADQVTELRRGF